MYNNFSYCGDNSYSAAGGFVATGLPCAKKRILIASASPVWRATIAISRTFAVLESVAETTGYMFRSRKVPDTLRPTLTNTQFKTAHSD